MAAGTASNIPEGTTASFDPAGRTSRDCSAEARDEAQAACLESRAGQESSPGNASPLTSPLVTDNAIPLTSPLIPDKAIPFTSPFIPNKASPLTSPLITGKASPLTSPLIPDKATPLTSPLIPGLPDDMGRECLLRLPRADHSNARKVCKQWNSMIQSESFYKLRRDRGFQEGWLYVLSRDSTDRLWWQALDPRAGRWHDVPKMPGECARSYGVQCLSLQGQLFVIAGSGWFKRPKNEVWCYSPPATKWKKLPGLNESRCYSVGGVLEGDVYVVGGMGGENSDILITMEKYNPHEKRWDYVASLPTECELEDAVSLDGDLLVRHIRCVHQGLNLPFAYRYSPKEDVWLPEVADMARSWHGPSVVMEGQLYMLDQIAGLKLLHFNRETKSWVTLGRISPSLLTPPCKLIGHGGSLYIVGRGAAMVVVDLAVNKVLSGAGSRVLLTRRVLGSRCESDIVVSCVVLEC